MDLKGKTIVFCLPGREYSGNFLTSFIELVVYVMRNGGTPFISQKYSSMVNFARCLCAGADVKRGKYQTPFGEENHYDYMMWIDSDQVFSTEQFIKLLEMDKDIAAGWYCQPGVHKDGTYYTPVVEKMEDFFFEKNGYYKFLSAKEMEEKKTPFKADYIGFGWVLIKEGVFERMEYPWFAPKQRFVGEISDMSSEDVSFCIDARNLGIDIWVDPTCRVGHEKTLVI